MKKTIFEGTVNGVTYDNVQDYNEAINRAVAAGQPINASSNTSTVDDITETDNAAGNDISLFPGFAHCSSLDGLNNDFIPAGLEIPAKEFEDSINQLFNEKIIPAVAKMNKTQAERYKVIVEGIMRHLGDTARDYEQFGQQIDARLAKLNTEIGQLAKKAQCAVEENRIVQSTAALYNDINETVSARIEALNQQPVEMGHKDPVGPKGACGRCGSDSCCCNRDADSYIENVRKLVQTIFG